MARELHLEHLLNTNPQHAKSLFEDIRKFSAAHPLFVGITQTAPDQFIIQEKMQGTGITFKYKATVINKSEQNEVIYIAYPFFLVLTISFRFYPEENTNNCIVKEKVHIKGPMIFSDILKNLIGKMHPLLIANLNKHF